MAKKAANGAWAAMNRDEQGGPGRTYNVDGDHSEGAAPDELRQSDRRQPRQDRRWHLAKAA